MEKVLILLAAYNGEKYISEMIESLLKQDYKNIQIVLSDDNSTDNTVNILEKYAAENPDRITHYRSGLRFGNAQTHFMHLLQCYHDAPYIMFCDQDDIWHQDKISKTLKLMKLIEKDSKLPALVHTDLNVVGKNLEPIHNSFCKYANINGHRLSFNHILVHNVVTGCTVMINQSLAQIACCKEIQTEAIMMHDWWLAILASACGNIGFLDEATIDYRQHGNNTVGAKNVRSFDFLWDWLKSRKMKKSMYRCVLQAKAFLESYEDILPEKHLIVLKAFVSTQNKSIITKDWIYCKYKICKYGFSRKAAQFLGL